MAASTKIFPSKWTIKPAQQEEMPVYIVRIPEELAKELVQANDSDNAFIDWDDNNTKGAFMVNGKQHVFHVHKDDCLNSKGYWACFKRKEEKCLKVGNIQGKINVTRSLSTNITNKVKNIAKELEAETKKREIKVIEKQGTKSLKRTSATLPVSNFVERSKKESRLVFDSNSKAKQKARADALRATTTAGQSVKSDSLFAPTHKPSSGHPSRTGSAYASPAGSGGGGGTPATHSVRPPLPAHPPPPHPHHPHHQYHANSPPKSTASYTPSSPPSASLPYRASDQYSPPAAASFPATSIPPVDVMHTPETVKVAVIQMLAVQSYTKPELYNRLQKLLKTDVAGNYAAIVNRVLDEDAHYDNLQGKYSLAHEAWPKIDLHWLSYSSPERSRAARNMALTEESIRRAKSLQPCSQLELNDALAEFNSLEDQTHTPRPKIINHEQYQEYRDLFTRKFSIYNTIGEKVTRLRKDILRLESQLKDKSDINQSQTKDIESQLESLQDELGKDNIAELYTYIFKDLKSLKARVTEYVQDQDKNDHLH